MLNPRFFPERVALSGGDLFYKADYLAADRALTLFEQLRNALLWEQSRIKVYGKEHPIPRLNAWYGDEGLSYRYSGREFIAHRWTSELKHLCNDLNDRLGTGFNSVLANYYRSGADAMGWHADNEPELGPAPTIACISLGTPRDLRFRHSAGEGKSFAMKLASGSLLVMGPGLQRCWQHSLPRRVHAGARISLTFRQVTGSAHHNG